jgi:hypothetical protein
MPIIKEEPVETSLVVPDVPRIKKRILGVVVPRWEHSNSHSTERIEVDFGAVCRSIHPSSLQFILAFSA